MPLPDHSVNAAFNALCQVAKVCAEELEKFEGRNIIRSSDEGREYSNPLFQSFLKSIESAGVHVVTMFSPGELKRLQNILKPVSSTAWRSDREKGCTYSPLEILFMTATVYKNGGAQEFIASIFKTKSRRCQRMVTKFVDTVKLYAYKQLVVKASILHYETVGWNKPAISTLPTSFVCDWCYFSTVLQDV